MIEPTGLQGRLPKAWIADAVDHYGEQVVARWCAGLLARTIAYDDPESPSLGWIGGPHALTELRTGDLEGRGQDYWPRVWAVRALLYVWVDSAAEPVREALRDPAWRVREMASKVVQRRELGMAAEVLAGLAEDPVPRVRVAAVRALGRVAEAEAAEPIRGCLDDVDGDVRVAAETALADLSRRLDRRL